MEWVEFGQRRFLSLGPQATRAYAREAARQKEAELNSFDRQAGLEPITWAAFTAKYFTEFYPGHDLAPSERKAHAAATWSKSYKTMKREKNAVDAFTRIINPDFCHQITGQDRERFVQLRLKDKSVNSPLTVDAELWALRHLFNIMEDWKHRPEHSNPFAGRGKVTVGARRRRKNTTIANPKHYTFEEIQAILRLADKEAITWATKRLQALVYFVVYAGCRINETVHLEWSDIDLDQGIAWLYFKTENDVKTEGSEAPFGLPDKLIDMLTKWQNDKTCNWVFPNGQAKPWKSGGPGYRPFDQLRARGERAGVKDANWKRYRHSFATHGKGRFQMTTEQVRAQLRHTTDETQRHYTHDDLTNLRNAMKSIDFNA